MKAYNFSLPDQTDTIRSLTDWKGKWLVLYFYPKDDTPGCTAEACSFRDSYALIQAAGADVVGISKDTVKSHKKFAEKHALNFPILSDELGEVIEAYDAWSEKSMFGKTFMGIVRKTVIINPDGEIVKTYPKVTPKDHAEEILSELDRLMQK